jgi:hypothetical protein
MTRTGDDRMIDHVEGCGRAASLQPWQLDGSELGDDIPQ